MDWWYLSFAHVETFAGACVVRARDLDGAVREASRLGCNPGGEALGFPFAGEPLPPIATRERLLSEEQVKSIWPCAKTVAEHERDYLS